MKKKGITLIALIITIVILLILAGVTISFVVGDNGVVTQAQKSKIRTDQASAKEEIDLEVAGSRNDEGYLDLELLNENLMKNLKGLQLKKNGTTGDKDDDFENFDNINVKIESLPATVRYKGVNVKINEKKLISDLASNPENYGMYVDYPIDLDGDKNTSDWKIFYEDGTGRVFLIAADYVPNTCEYLYLNKEVKAENLIAGMEKCITCCLNWSSALDYTCYDGRENAKCENEKKKSKSQCSFPEIFMLGREDNEDEHTKNHYYCSDHVGTDGTSGKINSKCAASLQCTVAWGNFVNNSYAEYAIGGPTLEMWVASWNQRHGKKDDDDESSKGITLFANGNNNNSGTGYCIGVTANCTDTSKSIKECTEGYNDTLYFPHRDYSNFNLFEENGSSNNESGWCYGYWLASPSASGSENVMGVNCFGSVDSNVYEGGSYVYNCLGVRPIVSLKSGVYVEVQEEVKKGKKVIKCCTLVK